MEVLLPCHQGCSKLLLQVDKDVLLPSPTSSTSSYPHMWSSLRTRSSSSDRRTNLCVTDSATLAAPRVRTYRRSPRIAITCSILSSFPHHFREEWRNFPISAAIISPTIPQSVAVGFGDGRRRRGLLVPLESAPASSASASAAAIATVGVLCFTFARGMVRNARDADADDFMPDIRDAVAAGKRTAKQKIPRNRGSHERLTELYNDFNDDQKATADTMGMHTLMNLLCTNLNNNLCNWLSRTYEPESKELVIPHRGRIPLDEDAVYCTLGVPNGGMDVPYKVDREIQDRLFPEMFPGLTSMPLHSLAASMLSQMNSSGDDFKRLLLMYLISTVFAPTTFTHLSSRCFPVLADIKYVANMNWCKFIAGFLHTALSKRIYNKGCRLHLMLTYVDNVDLSTVNMSLVGGLPAPHKFAATAWTDAAIKAVLAADTKRDGSFGKLQLLAKHSVDFSFFGGPHNFSKWMDVHKSDACSLEARTNVEALVGQFASGMSNLLGNLVQGWTAMTMGDGAEVANQFRNFVQGGTSRPIGSRGRYKYNDSQVLPSSEDEFMHDLQDSDVDDYVRGNDGHAGVVQMDNLQSDPQNQQSRVFDDVATAAKVSAAPLSSAPGPSKDGAEVSKRGRDSEDEVRVSSAKRPKFDPVTARRSEVTVGGRVSKQANADPPARSSARPKKGPHTGAVSGCEPAHTATRSSPHFASSNTGDPVVLEDMRVAGRRYVYACLI